MAWMQAAEIGAGILSGVLGGNAQTKAAKTQARESRRQFDAQHALATRRQGLDEEAIQRRRAGLGRTGNIRDMILQRVMRGMQPPGSGVRPRMSPDSGPPPRPQGGY